MPTRALLILMILISHSTFGKKDTPRKEKSSLEKVTDLQKEYTKTDKYVHNWIPFPRIEGKSTEGTTVKITATKGRPQVVVFVASWCIPCQDILAQLANIKNEFQEHVSFTYIMAHDTEKESYKLSQKYNLSPVILATHQILKDFHNPALPSIYIGDRHGWIVDRYLNVDSAGIKDLRIFLSYLISF